MTVWAPESHHITARFKYVDIHKPDYYWTEDYLLISGETEKRKLNLGFYCGVLY